MSQGTLYGDSETRCILPVGLVKAFNLDVALEPRGADAHKAAFPNAKVPAFVGPHGYKLQESIAVIYYLINLHDPESPLLGTDLESKAQVLKYISWATSELMVPVTTVISVLGNRVPFNKKALDDANKKVDEYVAQLSKRLTTHTYLVGERLTAADLFVAQCFYKLFTLTFGKEWRSKHTVFMRWINTVYKSEFLSYKLDSVKFVDEPVKPQLPKKEKKAEAPKKEQPKKEAKPAAAAAPAESTEEKKPKHPLELLGKPAVPLDEWKRTYSNKETREEALPYFWNTFYNDNDWSIWKVEYKYNDELTLTFMSNNLVGGFFNRLSASTKYMFGCAVVYGENNNNGIIGAFVVRGKDAVPAFNVAPDWESYSYSPLDASKQEDREFLDNMWAWDKPVVINGENKEIADGTLYGDTETRSIAAVGLIKAFNLDIKIEKRGVPEHRAAFPSVKAPSFIGPHGYKLHEVVAVLYYFINLHDPKSTLLGTDLETKAQVLRYLSWGTTELMKPVRDMKFALESVPNDVKAYETSKLTIDKFVNELEEELKLHSYLVGDTLTVADLFVLTCFNRPFNKYFDKQWVEKHPTFIKWATKIMHSEYLSYYYKDFKFINNQIELK